MIREISARCVYWDQLLGERSPFATLRPNQSSKESFGLSDRPAMGDTASHTPKGAIPRSAEAALQDDLESERADLNHDVRYGMIEFVQLI